ncbi:MAG: DUF4157 domain-containing protein [Lewinellaceae bacterium]|nr:DUF4157 domain-containing protein [Lewinellaceae bacterium]
MPNPAKTSEPLRAKTAHHTKEENNQPFFAPTRHAQSDATAQPSFFQPKLTINEPGDRHEQEADAMAERVMRMAAAPGGAGEAPENGGALPITGIQRKCANCEAEDKLQRQEQEEQEAPVQRKAFQINGNQPIAIQRKCADCATEEDVQRQEMGDAEHPLMRKAEGGGYTASPQLQSELHSSKGGGSPLPGQTLASMNQAFGADFSSVRIHTDDRASEMSQGIQAKAFTHGSDIYFNRGAYSPESSEGKRLLGHELTHVVQQGHAGKEQKTVQQSPIQMFAPYWEPKHYNGDKNHNLLLPLIGKELKIFTEAPVPNANKINQGHGNKGSADMYQASTTVGVYFLKHNLPKQLKAQPGKRVLKDGAKFPHDSQAAPKVDKLQNLSEIPSAPGDIVVGDLKPSHGTIEAQEGTGQLNNYIGGFESAKDDVNDMSAVDKWTFNSPPAKLSTAVPPGMTEPNSPVASEKIVLKNSGKIITPVIETTGKVYVNQDPGNPGIWNYTWKPDKEFTDPLPASVTALGLEIENKVRKPVFISPMDSNTVAPKFNSKKPVPENTIQRAKRTKDKDLPKKDWFNYNKWRDSAFNVYQGRYKSLKKTAEFQTAEQQELALQDQKARVKSGFKSALTGPQETSFDKINQLQFWVSEKAQIFGRFRGYFGTLFVKIAKVYNRVKSRFQNRLNTVKSSGGGGIAGAAIKAAFRLIIMAGKIIITETVSRLKESFTTGVSTKLKSLVPTGSKEALEGIADDLNKRVDAIKQKAAEDVDKIVKSILGPYEAIIEKIKAAADTLGKIKKVINLVKWGARAIACTTSPPILGCLVTPAIEYLASKVVQSCWFMEKMAPYIQDIPYLGKLSLELARIIREKIQAFLPESVKDVFAPMDEQVDFDTSDIKCPEGSGGPELTPEQQAMLDLQERLGEEKYQALIEMMKKLGLPSDAPMPLEKIEELGDALEDSELTAADIEQFTDQNTASNPGATKKLMTIKDTFDKIKENAGQSKQSTGQQQSGSNTSGDKTAGSIKDELVLKLKQGEFDERFKTLIKSKRLKKDQWHIDNLRDLKQGEVISGRLVLGLGESEKSKLVGLAYFEVQSLIKQSSGKDKMTIKFNRDLTLYDVDGTAHTTAQANSTLDIFLEFKVE